MWKTVLWLDEAKFEIFFGNHGCHILHNNSALLFLSHLTSVLSSKTCIPGCYGGAAVPVMGG